MAQFHLLQAEGTRGALHTPLMIAAGCLAALAGIPFVIARKPLPKIVEAGMLSGWAVMTCVCLIELLLKPVFGRTAPLDFLADAHYGFHWFHGTIGKSAFPSGHAGQAAAILSVLWAYYPRWRWLYVVAMVTLAVLLMLGEWHFLSDIIAGTFIGAALGTSTMWVWRAISRRKKRPVPLG
jgi:membrane-associated phospholipid phosphatase